MSPSAANDVVVRTFNSERTLGATLDALAAQTRDVRVVVVDSGSTDGTLELAARYTDTLVELPPGGYTPGRALNAGFAVCTSPVVFAISSHVVPAGRRWMEASLEHHADADVLAVCGAVVDVDGQELTRVVRQDLAHARQHPLWGLTNTAVSFRGDLLRAEPMDEGLSACEDKEWALRALRNGGVVVIDPAVAVDSSHRTGQGLGRYFNRVRDERRVLLDIGALPRRGTVEVARQWWSESRNAGPGRRGFTSVTRALDSVAEAIAQRQAAQASSRAARRR